MRSVVNCCFVTFVLPSSGPTLAIYYTLYGLCQRKPLDGRTYATKKTANFWRHSPPISPDICSTLYFYFMYLCDCNTQSQTKTHIDKQTHTRRSKTHIHKRTHTISNKHTHTQTTAHNFLEVPLQVTPFGND